LLLLPATNEEAAHSIARRFMRMLSRAAIPHRNSRVEDVLTVSVGVATIVPGAHDTPGAFIDLADTRLYQAKTGGRNRIVGSNATA
jgi:diguanylate cyclase (GGDEF)-like protein